MQPLVSFKSYWKPISFRCRKSRLRRDSCLYPDIVIMISHKIRVRWRTSYCQGQSVFVVGVKYYSDKKHWDIWQVKSLDRFIYLKYILSNRRHKIAHLRSSKTEISPHSYFVSFDNCVFMVWLSLGTKVTWLVWGKDRVWIQIQLKKCPVVSPLQKVKLHPVQSFLWYENLHTYRSDRTDLACRNVKYQLFAPVRWLKFNLEESEEAMMLKQQLRRCLMYTIGTHGDGVKSATQTFICCFYTLRETSDLSSVDLKRRIKTKTASSLCN